MQNKSTQTDFVNIKKEPIDTLEENTYIKKYNEDIYQCNMEIASTKSILSNVYNNYEKLKNRFHKLHSDYHKLIRIAGQLTTTLEESVKGYPVNLQEVLETCIKIYPDLFNKNITNDIQFNLSDMVNVKAEDVNYTPVQPNLLDFKKIKLHLICGNINVKLLLLQALRWKITKAKPEDRDEVIHEYIEKDLFGLHGRIANVHGKLILPDLLVSENVHVPYILQQTTARLLNAIASYRCGRDYLSDGRTVVTLVFNYLVQRNSEKFDPFTCDMMIALLQKLSLRKQQRLYMIEAGILELLVNYLHNENSQMSYYGLDFSTALLMNLSLQKQGRARASTIAPLLITTLIKLLEVNQKTALLYVNGALNNFLFNPVINEEAKKVQLLTILKYYSKQKDGEVRDHLEEIIKTHRKEYMDNAEEEEIADNDNEELDILENEIDFDDPVKSSLRDLCGEALLATYYAVTKNVADKQKTVQVPKMHCEFTPILYMEEKNPKQYYPKKKKLTETTILPKATFVPNEDYIIKTEELDL